MSTRHKIDGMFEDGDDGAVFRSGQNLTGKSSVFNGEPVDMGTDVSPNVLVFKRARGGKTFFDFVENTPDAGTTPQVYTYCLETGNITRGSGGLWARQEIRSGSKAFHKGNANRMAIPNDLKKAAAVISSHLDKYTPRSKPLSEPPAEPDDPSDNWKL